MVAPKDDGFETLAEIKYSDHMVDEGKAVFDEGSDV